MGFAKMNAKVFLTLALGAVALAAPAAVPASQPTDIRLDALGTTSVAAAPDRATLLTLLADPSRTAEFSLDPVDGYTTLEWIDQDPFAF